MTELDVSRIYSYSELSRLGYSSNALTELIRNNKMTRVQRGFYALKKDADELFNVVQLFPEGILCLESALYYHGYLKESPEVNKIAVHKKHNRFKYSHSNLALKAYFRDDKYIDLGVIEGNYQGLNCLVYDKERTLCDCLRRTSLLKEEDYKLAIKEYINDPLKDLDRLRKYAKELRITDKVEFLINSVM